MGLFSLQPTFKRLGIPMNTQTANALMREESGVAAKLLYDVKQSMASLDKNLKVRRVAAVMVS